MKLERCQQNVAKRSNTKFNQNLPSESRVRSCGRKVGRTNMAKLIVAFSNCENVPKTRYIQKSN
jgi:hypothetical protein